MVTEITALGNARHKLQNKRFYNTVRVLFINICISSHVATWKLCNEKTFKIMFIYRLWNAEFILFPLKIS